MLIVLKPDATPAQAERVCEEIRRLGFQPHPMPGAGRTAIGITGNKGPVNALPFESLAGVDQCIPVTKGYKLVLREMKPEGTRFKIKGTEVGGGKNFTIIAGPCSVESTKQMETVAKFLKDLGVNILRGGAFKPRTSPYSFQGLGEDGLKILREIGDKHDMPVVTEVMDPRQVPLIERYTDMFQIGARNMQNFALLKEAGRARKPVLLKRGMSATLEELLMSAEYLLVEGNTDVVLCERGIKTFSSATRNTLDLSIVPLVKSKSHLPIIVDPSHATGIRALVLPMSLAAIAAGADGLIIEVHATPETAQCDGMQQLTPPQFKELMAEVRRLYPVLSVRRS